MKLPWKFQRNRPSSFWDISFWRLQIAGVSHAKFPTLTSRNYKRDEAVATPGILSKAESLTWRCYIAPNLDQFSQALDVTKFQLYGASH